MMDQKHISFFNLTVIHFSTLHQQTSKKNYQVFHNSGLTMKTIFVFVAIATVAAANSVNRAVGWGKLKIQLYFNY